jgi:2-hydroxychromene-2-carboxylate isomerase
MTKTVDYYYSLVSPWTYFGGPRLDEMTRRAGATVNYKPMELPKVFAVSGGLVLAKRSAQRQAYRLVELARFRDRLGMKINLAPKFFPASDHLAGRVMVAATRAQGTDPGRLTNAMLAAVWAEDRNIADAETLSAICDENEMDGKALLAAAETDDVKAAYDANTAEAIERGIFGAPSYVYNDEPFWGQDRLEFLDRALAKDGG